MAWTPQKTWTSEVLTASDLNTYLRDDMEYLKGLSDGTTFSGTQLTRSSTQSIGDSAYTAIVFDAEQFDFGGWYTSGSQVIVPSGAVPSGYTEIACIISARVKFASNGTGSRWVQALVNGASIGVQNIGAINGDSTDVNYFEVAIVSVGDSITLEVKQSSGGNLNISNTNFTVLRYAPAS